MGAFKSREPDQMLIQKGFINHNNKGFTLIELIASLILAGILATVAGMGIVQASKAFLFTKQTTEISEKNRLAMVRMRRSIVNLTDVSAVTSTSITLNRLNNGIQISERYQWGGTSGNSLTVSIDNGAARPLADNVQNFSLSYLDSANNSWSVTDSLGQLANLSLLGGSGGSVTFSENVVPRNTYTPNASASVSPGAGGASGSPLCFIQTNAFMGDTNPAIRISREFKSRVLLKLPFGKDLIGLYYKFSISIKYLAGSDPSAGSFLRFLLMPFTGLAFLILYYPFGIFLIFLFSLILARVVLKLNFFKKRYFSILSSNRGSILISVIATVVIMALLSVGMVSMFSSSVTGSVPAQISQRAYYIAESGKRYAIKAFLDNQNNDQAFVNNLHIGEAFPLGNDSFTLQLEGYWYDKTTATNNFSQLVVAPFGSFPSEIRTQNLSGYIQLPDINGIVRYTSTSYNSGSNTVQFNLSTPVTNASGIGGVFLALRADTQTLTATQLGEDPNLAQVLVPENAAQTDAFPKVNGVISLKDSNDHPWVLVYRQKLTNGNLAGLQYPAGLGYTNAGILLADDTEIVLGRHAIFTSTGTSGTGSFQSTQTIKVHQPLDAIEIFKRIEGGIDFNNPGDINKINSKLGTHVIEDGALKVTSTDSTYSYTSFSGNLVYQQESLATVNWENTDFPTDFLKNIWDASDHKLSYDLQAKIKFTESEDDTDNAPVNHPGCYMPGLSFRVMAPNSGNFGQATYYGFSVMRVIEGLEQHSQSSGGCGGTTYFYTENDDITDNLSGDHSSNSSASTVSTCSGSTFTPSSWNDDPPLDGIPYLMLWQKDVSTDASGTAVGTGCFGGVDYSPWE